MKPFHKTGLLSLAGLIFLSGMPREAPADENTLEADRLYPAEISTIGMDRLTGAPVVLVRAIESGRVVPIWIGISEAQAIARALHGIEPQRPMTHDLMAALVRAGGSEIEEIAVHDIRDGTYYGAVHLVQGDGVMRIDSRPSDALALALRLDIPIRLAGKVIDEARDFQFIPPEESEQVVRVFGLTAVFPTEEHRNEFDLQDHEGALISDVSGVGAEGGLEVGDLITEVNGNPVRNPVELLNLTENLRPGTEVEITFRRDGEEQSVTLVVPEDEQDLVPI